MAEKRKQLNFSKSMTANKRNEDFAYLRKQVADVSADGLYPGRDYTEFTTLPVITSGEFTGVFGDTINFATLPYLTTMILHDKSIASPASYAYDWYTYGQTTPVTSFTGARITGVVEALGTVYYTTGTKIRSAIDTDDIATYAGSSRRTATICDGVYAWFIEQGNDIWRWIPGEATVEKIFNDNPFKGIVSVCQYGNQMVIFDNILSAYDENKDLVYFWDKSNSTFFQDRIEINGHILAGGLIENELYVVYSVANNSNIKEEIGDIIIAQWTGTKFVEVNRIKAGGKRVKYNSSSTRYYLSGKNSPSNNNSMYFSLTNNTNAKDEIYKNYIYKVSKGGVITVESETITGTAPLFINTFRRFNLFIDTNKIYTNDQSDETNTDYTNYTKTTYITNFLCNPYNTHRLDGMSFTFEKLFNVEELDIYYRTSDKESFVLLGNITRQKVKDNVNKRIDQSTAVPTPSQVYQITKMPDNTALPEFNEIQFKFVSKKGFSIIGAWFDYSYITRNMLK